MRLYVSHDIGTLLLELLDAALAGEARDILASGLDEKELPLEQLPLDC